jgi:membrane protease YdiL (CAAX protease family)
MALAFVVIVYFVSQILSGIAITIYPGLQNWSHAQTLAWLNNSVAGQFAYILIAETLAIGAVYWFLKRRRLGWDSIGLRRPKFSDPLYGLAALPAYFLILAVTVGVISHFVPGLDINQEQKIGFDKVHGTAELVMTFVSLVVLPPLAEEIMIRGFLYSGLRKAFKMLPAALISSLLFAAAHLSEGGSQGLLYIAAIDTFVLGMVLVYLREKSGGLWASITLHALKNGIAFVALFIIGTR